MDEPHGSMVMTTTPPTAPVRDYVHVQDLALSPCGRSTAVAAGNALKSIYNLGSGNGSSVRQIMDAMSRVTGIDFSPQIGPRRPGDPDRIVATGQAASQDLDWQMRHTLDEMVASAWQASQSAAADQKDG
ncbi:MAG: hypothetical protein R2709_07545 [Marmoricola sp.]